MAHAIKYHPSQQTTQVLQIINMYCACEMLICVYYSLPLSHFFLLSLSLSLSLFLLPPSLSALEAAVILSNLSRHSAYIKATTSYLLSHVRTNMNTIGPHLLPNERDRLNSDLSGAVAAVSSLREEMLSLQTELHSVGMELCMFTARFISEFVYREGLMCVCV